MLLVLTVVSLIMVGCCRGDGRRWCGISDYGGNIMLSWWTRLFGSVCNMVNVI